MHIRDSSSLMTFTFTLLSLLLLVMHLELQHAAAEAGRPKGQSSIRGQGGAVDSQSKKRGRPKGQSAKVRGSTSATISLGPPAKEGIDYFPRAAAGEARKCYSATFLVQHVHPFTIPCAMDKAQHQHYTTNVCESWCRKEHETYNASQTTSIIKQVAVDRCIQSFNVHITKETVSDMTTDITQSCASFKCQCTLSNYLERIKMPRLRYKGKSVELSPLRPKFYWGGVPALFGDPSEEGKAARYCHYEDFFESVGWMSDITDPATGKTATVKWEVQVVVNDQNLPCDMIDWDWYCTCRRVAHSNKHYFAPGRCIDGHKSPKFGPSTEQCLVPAGHRNTNANHVAHADASTSGQAALASNIAESFTSDQQMTSLELEEWLGNLYDVEKDLQNGLPVDWSILKIQSCNIPDLDNLPGSNQSSEEVCVAPTHAVQRKERQEEGHDDNQGVDSAGQGKAVLPARAFI
ncbi:hypothetical protein BCR37DRAFT_257517 [Protomyces lactucae-debilis]|uniref:Uncharacterized protein n=1 Tax=Protomyces lactucae-debilis TaxID=2754530 RepID=A0A1Y2FMA6_PROLT|nr:uncharacterized protein BCR37DRAFT_257517 [Protomyces lactucae-debilis]ORY85059.1 hypothetical protein BCR37DRAFT_257517 [Protomyces lactucae-debilis]